MAFLLTNSYQKGLANFKGFQQRMLDGQRDNTMLEEFRKISNRVEIFFENYSL